MTDTLATLQTTIPYNPLEDRRLPGVAPLDMEDWLIADEAFAGQMARRDRLLTTQPDTVRALDRSAQAAAEEVLDMALAQAYPGAGVDVTRHDGIHVPIDRTDPLLTLGRLVQEDVCILQKQGDEHVLTGAVLCFPASWSLDEKFMRPLARIHEPVDTYDTDMARRVQRLFDGVRPGRPLWRCNAIWYDDAELHQPRREGVRRAAPSRDTAAFLRSERQCILRLPETGAVVFSIHTYVVKNPHSQGIRRQVLI
ncbi:heme-dependent oxidative N-demethylase family protein [Arenibacterium halophilum]|uniref:DUF3445 domain-containing protein n=1 Tax=Arenibacterium halophilum TaxID=2583821 RepID=A0ABY2XA86_9RHOB|nr:DUF3445 domain-containing protein [Arenibacterium halophilum]TMV13290.1 DUF3445 domain-containing protein [Arenibacterium halophilum]